MDDSDAGDLLSIGRFARLSGLSIGALRHYDEAGLIHPAAIDRETSYRRYRPAQLETARVIARLRELEMPLDEIRRILAADDAERRSLLAAERARVKARAFRINYLLHVLGQLSTGKEPIVTAPPRPPELDAATRRQLAVGLFNHTWTLLEKADRTPDEDDEMLHAAHASRYHWGEVGGPENRARGEWQCSRVYAVLGRGEPALWHARRCLAICEEHGIADWDIAAAYEALARASLVGGERAEATRWAANARTALAAVADADDREQIEQDLAALGVG
jgi:DNA-binding transcriptional MerR regulator